MHEASRRRRNPRFLGFCFSGQIGWKGLRGFEAPILAKLSAPASPQTTVGRRRFEGKNPARAAALEVISDPLRSYSDLVIVMEIVSSRVKMLAIKYCGHQRWSDRRSVGSTRRPKRRRVRARPATSGNVVWSCSLHLLFRAC